MIKSPYYHWHYLLFYVLIINSLTITATIIDELAVTFENTSWLSSFSHLRPVGKHGQAYVWRRALWNWKKNFSSNGCGTWIVFSASRTPSLLDALGHTPTPFWSVLSCHLCFLPGDSHPQQILVDCSPVCMQTIWTSLKPRNLPVNACRGMCWRSICITCPSQQRFLSLSMPSILYCPVLTLTSSFGFTWVDLGSCWRQLVGPIAGSCQGQGPTWPQVGQVIEPLQVSLLWPNFWRLKQCSGFGMKTVA